MRSLASGSSISLTGYPTDDTFAGCPNVVGRRDGRSGSMLRYATFALGFAAGWVARGTTESSRAATLTVFASMLAAIDRIKRAVAIETDHLEDLIAEVRARADAMGEERAPGDPSRGPRRPRDEVAA